MNRPLCCTCSVPEPHNVFGGGVECGLCFRPCSENFAAMREAYRSTDRRGFLSRRSEGSAGPAPRAANFSAGEP